MKTLYFKEKIFTGKNGKRTGNTSIKNGSLPHNNIKQWPLEDLFTNERDIILMRVHTDILSGNGIDINDTVIINPAEEPLNDQIVVIKLDGEMLIRKYQKINKRLTFYGDPDKISPIQIEPGFDNFNIVGVVKFVVRGL